MILDASLRMFATVALAMLVFWLTWTGIGCFFPDPTLAHLLHGLLAVLALCVAACWIVKLARGRGPPFAP